MTNNDILETFLDIQENTMFSKSIHLDFARIIINDSDTSPFWNYALTSPNINKEEILKLEEKFIPINRKPTIYFENSNFSKVLVDDLLKNNYVLNNEDSWMFYEGKINSDQSNFDKVKRVETLEDLQIWLDTLNECYRPNDPHNPYGELGVYIQLAERAWKKNNSVGKFEYYIAYKNTQPVAVATITYQNNLAYISNVGSVQVVRGQGFGKLITLYCVHQAKNRNIEEICLATEEGTYPNEFYKKIGFKTRFTACGYVKNQ